MRTVLLWGALCCLSLQSFPAAATAEDNLIARAQAGFVVRVRGDWSLLWPGGGPARAEVGMAVPPNTLVRLRPGGAPEALIAVALFDGSVRECNSAEGCTELKISLPTHQSTLMGRCMLLFDRFFKAPKQRYISALSRNGVEPLREAIIPITGRDLDLSPAMTGNGRQNLRLLVQKSQSEVAGRSWSTVGRFNLTSSNPTIPRGSLTPGLYRLVEVGFRPNYDEVTGAEAWVLLVNEGGDGPQECSPGDIRTLMKAWPAPLAENGTVRQFLRFSLEQLQP